MAFVLLGSLCHSECPGEKQHFLLPFRFTLTGSSSRADMEMGRVRELFILQQNWPNALSQ